jgi:sugar O-acyltransferase (sialic acid O-acetyltransferase NeuD family)
MKKLILIGGGGHCRSVIDVVEKEAKYKIAGILDVAGMVGREVSGYSVIGTDDAIEEYVKKECMFLITLGQIKSYETRQKLYQKLKDLQASLATVVSPLAYVSDRSMVGEGTVIMHHAVINAGVTIGSNCIINTRALVEHDSVIASHCHISTGALVNGDCSVSEGCFIGSGAILLNGRKVAPQTVIGAGAVITKDIEASGCTYAGNPARKIK